MSLPEPIWARRLSSRSVIAIATVGYIGYLKPGPGTWGSAVGVLFFARCFYNFSGLGNLTLSAILAGVAVAICGEAEIRMKKKDPSEVVLDEVVAMPLCFFGWQLWQEIWPTWVILLAGFLVFRVFDITKPLGISRLQNLPGGWGVVIDDTAAAIATCITLHLAALGWRALH